MTEKEEAVFEKQLSSVLSQAAGKEEVASAPKKARKAYEWTEKRAEAFQKMRDGLALKVEVASQLKREKKEMEKKDIKERIAKIMNSAKKTKTKKMDSSSEEEEKPVKSGGGGVHMNSSESESEEDAKLMIRKHSHKSKSVVREEPRKSKSSSKRKEKVPVEVSDSESEQHSSSEEESFELASAKQKQHYRDAKVKLGKVQKSTRTLNALDNYILL
jgi:hypothetical protein